MTWKDLKLSQKLNVSFGIFLCILILFGGFAILELIGIKQKAKSLADVRLPALTLANNIERNWQNAAFNLRTFGYSKDEKHYFAGVSYLKHASEALLQLKALLNNASAEDTQKLSLVEAELNLFQHKATQTQQSLQELVTAYTIMDSASHVLKNQCQTYLALQGKKLKKDVDSGKAKHVIKRRVDKIDLMSEITAIINELNTITYRAEVEDNPDLLGGAANGFTRIRRNVKTIRPMTTKTYDLITLNTIVNSAGDYERSLNKLVQNWKVNRQLTNNTTISKGMGLIGALRNNQSSEALALTNKNASSSQSSQTLMIWGLITLLIISIFSSRFLASTLSRPILALVDHAQALAKGQITAIPDLEGKGETAILTRSLKQSGEKLTEIVYQLQKMSKHLNDLGGRLSSKSTALTDSSTTQASNAEEISASMEEMSTLTRHSSSNAMETVKIASQSSSITQAGISQTKEAMHIMNALIEKAKTIHDLSSQTYILSVNASIEAAKAGVAGRGFSVVGKGIRELAEHSKDLSKEIGDLSNQGIEISSLASHNLSSIENEMTKSVSLIRDIADSALEQQSEATQITNSIQLLNHSTQHTAQMAEEIALEAKTIESDAADLQQIIRFFKIEKNKSVNKKSMTLNTKVNSPLKSSNISEPLIAQRDQLKPDYKEKWIADYDLF